MRGNVESRIAFSERRGFEGERGHFRHDVFNQNSISRTRWCSQEQTEEKIESVQKFFRRPSKFHQRETKKKKNKTEWKKIKKMREEWEKNSAGFKREKTEEK